jgi:hypothetical protein
MRQGRLPLRLRRGDAARTPLRLSVQWIEGPTVNRLVSGETMSVAAPVEPIAPPSEMSG